jgi:hypothetical protein
MRVTGWANDNSAYEVRIGKPSRQQCFRPEWQEVEISVSGESQTYLLSETFWSTYPELREGLVHKWLLNEGLAPWPKGTRPALVLEPLGDNRFGLAR